MRFYSILSLALSLVIFLSACGPKDDVDPTADWSVETFYQEARYELAEGNYLTAIEYYETLESRFPFGKYATQAQIDVAYAYFKFEEPDSAITAIDRFIKLHPRHPAVDYAYYLKGLVNYEENLGFLERLMPSRVRDRDQSSAREAFIDFSELIRRYPDSRYVADARQRMVYLRNNLAAYEIEVADYYLSRGAYVAAANRARYALETYPNTPENAEALALLHRAYTELDLPELANGAMTVLELNYPDHYYVSGQKKKRSWASRLWPFD